MLRVGLTGGIGSGKSTAAAQFARLGALVVDSDLLAREVVAPGSPGLAAVASRFGPGVLAPDGSLDRAALAELVFADRAARGDLESITHPLVAAAARERYAAARPGQVVVHDVPLLVEKAMGAAYHLVVVVAAAEATRADRLVRDRGMSSEQAWARIRAQATDEQRSAAADVLLSNDGGPGALEAAVTELWARRLVPFQANLLARRPAEPLDAAQAAVAAGPETGERLAARVRRAMRAMPAGVDVGPATDSGAVRLTLTLARPPAAGAVLSALGEAGFFPLPRGPARDDRSLADPAAAGTEFGSADPGQPAVLTLG